MLLILLAFVSEILHMYEKHTTIPSIERLCEHHRWCSFSDLIRVFHVSDHNTDIIKQYKTICVLNA